MVPESDLESDDEDINQEGEAPVGIVTKKSKKKNKQQINIDMNSISRVGAPVHDSEVDRVTSTESGTRIGTGRESPTPSPIASDNEEDEEEDDEEEIGQSIDFNCISSPVLSLSLSIYFSIHLFIFLAVNCSCTCLLKKIRRDTGPLNGTRILLVKPIISAFILFINYDSNYILPPHLSLSLAHTVYLLSASLSLSTSFSISVCFFLSFSLSFPLSISSSHRH